MARLSKPTEAPVMTEAMARATPLAFTRGLVAHLEHVSRVRATESAIAEAKTFLRARRDLRNEPSDRKGHEYIVEILMRPRITEYAEEVLGIPREDSHRHIYSSHFHTTRDEPSLWRARWLDFKRAHPGVDTDDDGHSRRADLFISMGKAGLVSVEFKYLRAKGTPSAQACVGQVRQHLTAHRACVLVLYAGTPTSEALESTARQVRDDLRRENGFVVVMVGPPITFPERARQ
jgi:hypothetical protein